MDDEEEDMFRPISRCWGTPFMDVKFEDRATQTNSSVAVPGRSGSSLLHCRLAQESRPFHLRGNAGLRWHFPAYFEPTQGFGGPEQEQERERPRDALQLEGEAVAEREVQVPEPVEEQPEHREEEEEVEEGPRLAQRLGAAEAEEARMNVEVQIGRKLREIGDHFNQEQLQLFVQHQRDHLPLWWRVGAAVFGYLLQRVDVAPGVRPGIPR